MKTKEGYPGCISARHKKSEEKKGDRNVAVQKMQKFAVAGRFWKMHGESHEGWVGK